MEFRKRISIEITIFDQFRLLNEKLTRGRGETTKINEKSRAQRSKSKAKKWRSESVENNWSDSARVKFKDWIDKIPLEGCVTNINSDLSSDLKFIFF